MSSSQYLPYAPIIFIESFDQAASSQTTEMIKQISESQNTRIPSAVLNDVIMDAIAHQPDTDRQETPQNLHDSSYNQTTDLCYML